MPCIALPPPPIPTLPPGISIPVFSPPVIPGFGLCCKFPIPQFPFPAGVLTIPFPAVIMTAFNGYMTQIQAYWDLLQINCPLQ
jgi:hypothetical protein